MTIKMSLNLVLAGLMLFSGTSFAVAWREYRAPIEQSVFECLEDIECLTEQHTFYSPEPLNFYNGGES